MARSSRHRILWPVVASLAIGCGAALIGLAGPAVAQERNDNLVSTLRSINPPIGGLELEVVGGDRFLDLANTSAKTVVVKGYDDEPYLRFSADRTVEVNNRSPSKYVNEDRYGRRPVPARADSSATPDWQVVSKTGSYKWFDHRIHSMTPGTPPEVTDQSKRTKVFDWRVALTVDGRPARALGSLTWVPDDDSSSGPSGALIAALAVGALTLGGLLVLLRRRTGGGRAGRRASKEAW